MFDPSVFEYVTRRLELLDIDAIKTLLQPQLKGMEIDTPIFNAGAFLYRARKITSTFNKVNGFRPADLLYPPSQLSRLGRANREGQPIFYCSMSKEPVFFELPGLQSGDEIILSFWQSNARMFLNNVGYTQFAFAKLGAKRNLPWWTDDSDGQAHIELRSDVPADVLNALTRGNNSDLRRMLSECFMRPVGLDEAHHYKLTTAIAELHLPKSQDAKQQFAGLLYPSVRMWANGDNVALQPSYVDKHLEFKQALHIRVDGRQDTKFSLSCLDCARACSTSGRLIWFGHPAQWTAQGGAHVRVNLVAGDDKYGDYLFDKNHDPVHWEFIDLNSGRLIDSS